MTSFLSAKSLETLPEAVQLLNYNLMHFMHSLSISKEICENMQIAQISYASLCFLINFPEPVLVLAGAPFFWVST